MARDMNSFIDLCQTLDKEMLSDITDERLADTLQRATDAAVRYLGNADYKGLAKHAYIFAGLWYQVSKRTFENDFDPFCLKHQRI